MVQTHAQISLIATLPYVAVPRAVHWMERQTAGQDLAPRPRSSSWSLGEIDLSQSPQPGAQLLGRLPYAFPCGDSTSSFLMEGNLPRRGVRREV